LGVGQKYPNMKKRQEIGRGVRLAVNQLGERIYDERINILTVVANESYEKYVSTLQGEYEEEYGKEGIPEKPERAANRITIKLKKERAFSKEFQDLWERIKHKTRYAVKVDSEKLIDDVVEELNKVLVKPPRIVVSKAYVDQQCTGFVVKPVHRINRKSPLESSIEIRSSIESLIIFDSSTRSLIESSIESLILSPINY
jgi:restriction endonuclease